MLKTILVLAIFVACANAMYKPSVCTFPFTYKGQTYNECTEDDGGSYWCSVYAVYNGSFAYCQKAGEKEDITEEHFLKLLKKAEENAERVKKLQESQGKNDQSCGACLAVMKSLSKTVISLSKIFADQNKRIQGLKKQHNKLKSVITNIKKYYQMRRCKQTEKGADYLGRLSVSVNGNKCQTWASQSPRKHSYTQSNRYADNDIRLAKNSCRNPDLRAGPWCLTVSGPSQESCYIPKCNTDCKVDDGDTSKLPLCDAYQSVTCPHGSKFFKNNCYKLVTHPETFANAERICTLYKGHLASVHSPDENLFLAKTLYPSGNSFFIGLNDRRRERHFEYTDGSPYNYKRFYGGEPNNAGNEDCVEVGRYRAMREAWNDIGCNAKRPYICKIPLK